MVSIIFPTHNNWPLTKNCLKSIAKLKYPKDQIEVIVVDNASSDRTQTLIRKNFPKVKFLAQKSNLFFSKAVNIGAKSARGEYLFITNNDVTFESDFLSNLVNFADSDFKIGATGGKIKTWKLDNKYFDYAHFLRQATMAVASERGHNSMR